MYHTKVMVVDDLWTSVGSTNFDNRSFRLNDDRWRGRPWHQRAADWLAGLLRLQL
jgi:phosphatidylserine/phosphatidylglycerophosphate/cardiolipin synthase-like enzyme